MKVIQLKKLNKVFINGCWVDARSIRLQEEKKLYDLIASFIDALKIDTLNTHYDTDYFVTISDKEIEEDITSEINHLLNLSFEETKKRIKAKLGDEIRLASNLMVYEKVVEYEEDEE